MSRIDEIDIDAAAHRLSGIAHRTPVLRSTQLDQRVGAQLFLKAENLQRMGAFKFRGAYNRVSTLSPAERAAGVVTSSSGNHAQALALAARLCDTQATILMPSDAPASKRAATQGYGGKVVDFGRYTADREALTAALASELGATIVHAYDDPYIISGAGTAALELVEETGELDTLLVCTGGGGLLAGCSLAVKARHPQTQVYGVEPEASDDWQRSLQAGRRVRVEVASTVADGQQLATPGELNFAVARALLAGIVTVTDDEVVSAMRFLFERMKLVVEPSGASALAALLAGKLDVRGLRVGVTLSGGNIDAARFASLVP
jgi:threo-3-hydroxy-L-aspartate ammonia-lyase